MPLIPIPMGEGLGVHSIIHRRLHRLLGVIPKMIPKVIHSYEFSLVIDCSRYP